MPFIYTPSLMQKKVSLQLENSEMTPSFGSRQSLSCLPLASYSENVVIKHFSVSLQINGALNQRDFGSQSSMSNENVLDMCSTIFLSCIKKTFDTVHHAILLRKIFDCGFQNDAVSKI